MEQRLRTNPARFRQRKALVEHPFGTRKRGMDPGDGVRTGRRKGRGEFRRTVLAYDLKRVINRLGVPRLLEAVA